MHKKKLITLGIVILVIAALVGTLALSLRSGTTASPITAEEAEAFVNEQADAIAATKVTRQVAEKNYITVNSLSYGSEKDIILDCTVKTLDLHSVIAPNYDGFLSADERKEETGMYKSKLNFKQEFEPLLLELATTATEKETSCRIYLYDTHAGLTLYASDEVVNAVFGGLGDIEADVMPKTSAVRTNADGTTEVKNFEAENIKLGFLDCLQVKQNNKPDTASALVRFWNKQKGNFHKNFIEAGRWKTIFTGLWTTIKLTVFALILGIIIGFLVAFVRATYLKKPRHGILLKIINGICQVYLTVIRGTPVVVQIMIIYFVIFMPLGIDKFLAAVVCFGLNSGAYVAEIVRGGIMSIDNGQTEAGRSLGFGYMPTMFYIVLPQAFKTVLPSLANEFVVLLKETSIAFYIGLGDLMYSINAIRAATYTAFMPLIASAIIYLVMVLILQHLVSLLERRLRNSER